TLTRGLGGPTGGKTTPAVAVTSSVWNAWSVSFAGEAKRVMRLRGSAGTPQLWRRACRGTAFGACNPLVMAVSAGKGITGANGKAPHLPMEMLSLYLSVYAPSPPPGREKTGKFATDLSRRQYDTPHPVTRSTDGRAALASVRRAPESTSARRILRMTYGRGSGRVPDH